MLSKFISFLYNFYSPNYNYYELAEGYGWKEFMFCVLCGSVLNYVFARGLAKVKCGGI
jgi:hypothetical protein